MDRRSLLRHIATMLAALFLASIVDGISGSYAEAVDRPGLSEHLEQPANCNKPKILGAALLKPDISRERAEVGLSYPTVPVRITKEGHFIFDKSALVGSKENE